MALSGNPWPNAAGEARGVPSPCELAKGAWSACAISKSSGRARDLIMRSRSSLVRRLSFARLRSLASCFASWVLSLPVLEPDLHLSRAESGDLARETFAVSSVWVGLSRKFAHEEPGLVVSKPEPLHLALSCSDLGSCHWFLLFIEITVDVLLFLVKDDVVALLFYLLLGVSIVGRRRGQPGDWTGRRRATKGDCWQVVRLDFIHGWQ